MNALTIALLSILCTLVIGGIVAGVILAYRRSRKDATEGIRMTGELVRALEAHTKSIDQYSEAMKAVPALVSGLGKLAAAQLVEVQNLRNHVKSLKESIFKRDSDVDRVQAPGDIEKDYAWRAQEIVTEKGVSYERALQQVIEEEARGITSQDGFNLG